MGIPAEVRTKFYALRTLAALIALSATAVFILRPHDFGIRSVALLGVFLVLWIVKRSNILVWRARRDVLAESLSNKVGRVGPLAWAVAAASLLACGVCYFLMYLDALHGGKEVWPVYAFFVSALTLVLTFGNVVVRISR